MEQLMAQMKIRLLIVFVLMTGSLAVARLHPAEQSGAGDPRTTLSATNEHHKLLATLVGRWSFTARHIVPDSSRPPFEFTGAVQRRELWGGRYFIVETTGGETLMPWSGNERVPYREMSIEGYDNVKARFVNATIHNESDTGIVTTEGTYDPTTRSIVFTGQTTSHTHRDTAPGTHFQFDDVLKIVDEDHYTFVRRETVGGKEIMRTELTYTRTKDPR